MARKSRIQYAGARYHLINRGNYRSWIFETAGSRKSFLKCLDEVCTSMEWRLHGWAKGTNEFRKAVLEDLQDEQTRTLQANHSTACAGGANLKKFNAMSSFSAMNQILR